MKNLEENMIGNLRQNFVILTDQKTIIFRYIERSKFKELDLWVIIQYLILKYLGHTILHSIKYVFILRIRFGSNYLIGVMNKKSV